MSCVWLIHCDRSYLSHNLVQALKMQLVAYGAQDVYLTGNPQITST